MKTTMPTLLGDLAGEQEDLDLLVGEMADGAWDAVTPADGWAIRDQMSHLAYFDDVATTAIEDPGAIEPLAAAAVLAAAEGRDPMDEHLRRGRAMAPGALLAWWRTACRSFVKAAATLDPAARVPWFGPSMSPLSFVSARLMETWAHGQDIADALGVERRPTDRLAHVAELAVRARPFSYAVRGLDVPAQPVRIELVAPSGAAWTWHEDAHDSIRGPALDFCLVTTQRRHVSDTALVVDGDSARQWISIAQVFAGPPGPGRAPLSSS
ncbi:MAG: TIGR03084 family metal-binding protein [Acidimicrobiales bacterium]